LYWFPSVLHEMLGQVTSLPFEFTLHPTFRRYGL
jgi:hypothetical protein